MRRQLHFRHLDSVVILAEELNFTRAANRLRISQPALSKQICEIEKQHGFRLFSRNRKTGARLTEAGRAFVQEARSALLHADRAIQLARVAQYGCENLISVGLAPFADQGWVSTLLGIQLPQFPKLKVRLLTHLAVELVQSVLSKEIDLALVTAPPPDHKLTIVPFGQTQLCAIVPETHQAVPNEQVRLRHLAEDEWMLFPRRVNPVIHDTILDTAGKGALSPRHTREISTAQEAFHLVSKRAGVAIVPWQSALGLHAPGVMLRQLSDPSLSFQTCLVMRHDDDRRLLKEFARVFLHLISPNSGQDPRLKSYSNQER